MVIHKYSQQRLLSPIHRPKEANVDLLKVEGLHLTLISTACTALALDTISFLALKLPRFSLSTSNKVNLNHLIPICNDNRIKLRRRPPNPQRLVARRLSDSHTNPMVTNLNLMTQMSSWLAQPGRFSPWPISPIKVQYLQGMETSTLVAP